MNQNAFVVCYTSNYDSSPNNHECVGVFFDKTKAIKAVIPWLIRNKLGGFDALAELFSDRVDDNDGELPEEWNFDPTDENFIAYYDHICHTWEDLEHILDSDGDSYFKDMKGWNIHIHEMQINQ